MAATCVYFVFESEITKVKEVLSSVLSCMKNQFPYISESDLFDLKLVYNELLVNAVIHGNGEDSSKKVELLIEIEKDEISSYIRDEGNGFDYLETLNKESCFNDFFNDHGRGLRLVSSLTEYLNFDSVRNEIEFHKRISR